MKPLSIEEIQKDLQALDAADHITNHLETEFAKIQKFDTKEIVKKAMPMLMSGKVSLEAFGLSPKLFEQVQQVNKLNTVGRAKLRARLTSELNDLKNIEEAEVTNA
ncbi:hypothetical protein BTO00_22375 [Vibrio campbellii]|uniref:hypothetical protein n=1 Tax=Vibrio campbellii TaxID=680 RepID=UPI000CF4E673|nr:hypothetical protein [Vibrio campbellii]PQJ39104.1 hypothetical protein BTO00_22375 [Vibrio campbellii]